MSGHTIVEYFAEHERYKCGYCGSADTNYSHGMWAHAMTVQDYQDLLDRGWRRSGKYVYKPTMEQTCCPQYTIRCEANDFKLRKSHKKALKKVNKFLIHGIKSSCDKNDDDKDDEDFTEAGHQSAVDHQKTGTQSEDVMLENQSEGNKPATQSAEQEQVQPSDIDSLADKATASEKTTENPTPKKSSAEHPTASETISSQDVENKNQTKTMKTPRNGEGADPTKPPCKKAKDIRREKKLAKLAAKGLEDIIQTPETSAKNEGKTLEDFINEPNNAENCAHKLEMRLVRSGPRSEEFEASVAETHALYHKYQMAIHKDPPEKPNMRQFTRFLIDSPLEVRLVRSGDKSGEISASYEESYQVYKRYQMCIHKDGEEDCSKRAYDGFLVESPLQATHPNGSLPMGYGSFHQQYILDGKIICVGVIDILPSLVSSKYLYYDPDYSFLSLGTYSALREMAFVRELHTMSAEMIYYYMGFYIHSCPKMKYKGQYFPSYLLCPETYIFCPVEKCAPILDEKTYARFADEGQTDKNSGVDNDTTLVLYKRQMMTYSIYKALSHGANNDEDEVTEYAGFVGKKCASSILLYRK